MTNKVTELVHNFASMTEAQLGEAYESHGLDPEHLKAMGDAAMPGTGIGFAAGVLVGASLNDETR